MTNSSAAANVIKLFSALFVLATSCVAQTTRGEQLPGRDQPNLEKEKGPLGRYLGVEVRPRTFTDSSRLDALVRGGNLYLSLHDAILLALENNLDVEYQRITPLLSEADLLRARAGGVLRGVSSNVQEGPTGLSVSSTGSTQQGISGTAGTQTQAGTSTVDTNVSSSGFQVATSGPVVPSLDPAIIGSIGWNKANRPQTNTFITGTNALTSTTTLGDLGIQKGFLTGGMASLGFDATRQNTNNLRSDINPSTAAGLAFNFSQPLLRGFGLAVNNRYIRIAKNNRQVSDLVFEQQVISTVFAVTQLYWDLVSLESNARVTRQSLELAERLLSENQKQEEAGTLAPIEVTRARAEVARARRDLTVAETRQRQQETVLKDYITRQSVDSPVLAPLRVIATDSITPPGPPAVQPIRDMVETALKQRPEVRQAQLQTQNSRITLTGSRSALLPSVNLVASARSNALYGDTSQLPPLASTGGSSLRQPDPAFIGGFGTGLSQVFNTRFPDYGVELQLNIPLSNRAARADYERDQLAVEQQEIRSHQLEKRVSVDVSNALIAVEQSRAAYEAAREAREFQEQSLEAEREKYSVGVSTNYTVIQYQRDLAQAQSAEVAALADHVKAQATLDRAMGQLLQKYGVSVAEAYQGRMSNR